MDGEQEVDLQGQIAALTQCVAITLAMANHASGRSPQTLVELKVGLIDGLKEVVAKLPADESYATSAILPAFDKTVESIFQLAEMMQGAMKK